MSRRWATTGMFFVNGAVIGVWVSQIPWTQERFDLSKSTLGIVLVAMSIAVIVATPFAGQVVTAQDARSYFGLNLADLYAGRGIRSNAVCPGPSLTPAWLSMGGLADQTAGDTDRSRDDVLRAVAKGRPLGRMAEPSEIAAVIVFLCSPQAGFVTGAAWSADGGSVPIII